MFASVPLAPVTTTLAACVSRISCTFGSDGRKLFRIPSIWCSFAGSVPKRPSKCQRKSRPGASVKKKLIRHLGGQPGRRIGGGFPDQAPENSPDESEISHVRGEFTLPEPNIH